jgi:hypothetical protein
MNSFTKAILGTVLALSFSFAPPRVGAALEQEPSKPGVKAATLDEKIAGVLPKASEEAWNTIPWRFDFAAARAEANREGKPMFVWMMNGNPLGCT